MKPREFWIDTKVPLGRNALGWIWYRCSNCWNESTEECFIEKSAYDKAVEDLKECKLFILRCESWFARHGDMGHKGEAHRIAYETLKDIELGEAQNEIRLGNSR